MRLIILFFILLSCTQPKKTEYKSFQYLNFNKNLTFNEFENLLQKYSKISPYPNINK